MTALEQLELDIDLRMTKIWEGLSEISEWDLESVAVFIRAAYGKGYHDALSEPVRGTLCKDHGYPTPSRKCA